MLADTTEVAPQETLAASISATIAEAVRVDWARIDTGSGMDDGNHRFPLEHRGEVIGSLVVASPPGGRFGAKDLALLRDLARYAAVVVFADRHHGALRDSRARIVAAREEERRRLRRDLHDGIGPSLAAVVLKLNAAETRTDAQERHAILKEARSEVKEAIDEVRRLVDDLRPPAIDEVGLLAAIRQRALGLSEAVVFEVRGPTAMPDLPAAVETAAFRIAAEAMTNVARHASATRCEVDITITGDEFAITVTDNGRGAASTVRSGMGWESMRERAAELGGSCTLTNGAPGTGLSVHAVLPRRPSPGHLAEAGERA
jgi:signal transduction histidine kinase